MIPKMGLKANQAEIENLVINLISVPLQWFNPIKLDPIAIVYFTNIINEKVKRFTNFVISY